MEIDKSELLRLISLLHDKIDFYFDSKIQNYYGYYESIHWKETITLNFDSSELALGSMADD